MKKVFIYSIIYIAALFYSLSGAASASAVQFIWWGTAYVTWNIHYEYFYNDGRLSDILNITIYEAYNVGFHGTKVNNAFVDLEIIGPEDLEVPPGHRKSFFEIREVNGRVHDYDGNPVKITLADIGIMENPQMYFFGYKINDTTGPLGVALMSSTIFFIDNLKEMGVPRPFGFVKSQVDVGIPPDFEDLIPCVEDVNNGCTLKFSRTDDEADGQGSYMTTNVNVSIYPGSYIDIPPAPIFNGPAISLLLLGLHSSVITLDTAEGH